MQYPSSGSRSVPAPGSSTDPTGETVVVGQSIPEAIAAFNARVDRAIAVGNGIRFGIIALAFALGLNAVAALVTRPSRGRADR
jgi:hypothetical protein